VQLGLRIYQHGVLRVALDEHAALLVQVDLGVGDLDVGPLGDDACLKRAPMVSLFLLPLMSQLRMAKEQSSVTTTPTMIVMWFLTMKLELMRTSARSPR